MKKFIFTFLIASGIFACCDSIIPRWNISDFELNARDPLGNPPLTGFISTDTLILETFLTKEFVASLSPVSEFFAPNALATSCPHDGDLGMSDGISAISITSDSEFNGIEPGMPLNSLVLANGILDLDTFISQTKTRPSITIHFFEFWITQKPQNDKTHKFTVKLDFESGSSLQKNTEEITWE